MKVNGLLTQLFHHLHVFHNFDVILQKTIQLMVQGDLNVLTFYNTVGLYINIHLPQPISNKKYMR